MIRRLWKWLVPRFHSYQDIYWTHAIQYDLGRVTELRWMGRSWVFRKNEQRVITSLPRNPSAPVEKGRIVEAVGYSGRDRG